MLFAPDRMTAASSFGVHSKAGICRPCCFRALAKPSLLACNNHHANLKARIPHSKDVVVMAVLADNPVIVKRLLDHGADPSTAATGSTDGLITAIIEGNAAMVTLLLDHGADPCAEDRSRQRSHDVYQATHRGEHHPLISAADIARRRNLPGNIVARLTCPGFDTASPAGH